MHSILIPTFAIFNNITPGSIFILALIGLLLFGKDLPTMARSAAKQYFRYKKMITDATSDIQREMESAANQIEEEKRKLEREVTKEMQQIESSTTGAISDAVNHDTPAPSYDSSHDAYSNPTPGHYAGHTPIEAPSKPQADPLSLDVASPSHYSHRATDPAKSPATQVAALDSIQKNVPPPKKIPPVL